MKKFIKNFCIFITIISIVLIGLISCNYFIVGNQYQYNYQLSLVSKVERLQSIEEPKIILVGNSNLAFGIDSKIIEQEMNMPVVNLGLHGALGNPFHEQIAKLNINKGDIVVICHTSFSDQDKIENTALAWITVQYDKTLWKIIRKQDYFSMLKSYPNYLKTSGHLWLTQSGNKDSADSYSTNAFNEYGDVVYRPIEAQIDIDKIFSDQKSNVPDINDICIDRLNEYNKYITDRGATMVVAGYPIARGQYSTSTEEDFVLFKQELESKLDCDVISDYTDYFYPYDYFYITHLHLTEEGAKVRTHQLVEDLKNWIN